MMMPDVNLLVAFAVESHTDHETARAWFAENSPVATCPITELGMLRILLVLGVPVEIAEKHVANFIATKRKIMLPCDLSASALKGKVKRHAQVTDRYLVELCEKNGIKLATLDKGIQGAVLVSTP